MIKITTNLSFYLYGLLLFLYSNKNLLTLLTMIMSYLWIETYIQINSQIWINTLVNENNGNYLALIR
jgi:hypothetical protein